MLQLALQVAGILATILVLSGLLIGKWSSSRCCTWSLDPHYEVLTTIPSAFIAPVPVKDWFLCWFLGQGGVVTLNHVTMPIVDHVCVPFLPMMQKLLDTELAFVVRSSCTLEIYLAAKLMKGLFHSRAVSIVKRSGASLPLKLPTDQLVGWVHSVGSWIVTI